jgi:hypothetical protein
VPTHGEHGAQAGVAALSLGLLRRTDRLDLDFDAGGSLRRYGEDTGLNRDDQQVVISLARRGEAHVLQATASVTRDTTLTSELGTTGITGYNQRHRARALSLAPQWQLTERLATGVTLGWQDSTYGRNPQSRLADYSYSSAGFNASFDVSEITSASLVVSASRLDSASYEFNTHSLSALLQLQHAFSPRWQASLSGGPSRVETSRRTTSGSVFGANISRKGERLTIDTSVERSIAPTGSGLLSRRDEFGLRASAALSSQLDLAIWTSMVRSREIVPQFSFTLSDVRYTRAELSLSWRVARDWSVGLATGNSRQQSLHGGALGQGFDARVSLAWQRQQPVG